MDAVASGCKIMGQNRLETRHKPNTTHKRQHVHANTYMPTYICQHIHANTCMPTYTCQHMHANTCMPAHTCNTHMHHTCNVYIQHTWKHIHVSHTCQHIHATYMQHICIGPCCRRHEQEVRRVRKRDCQPSSTCRCNEQHATYATYNMQHATCNMQHAIRNTTCNAQHEHVMLTMQHDNKQSAACIVQHACNMQRASCNERTACNMRHTKNVTCDMQHALCNTRHTSPFRGMSCAARAAAAATHGAAMARASKRCRRPTPRACAWPHAWRSSLHRKARRCGADAAARRSSSRPGMSAREP